MKKEENVIVDENEIRVLGFPEAIRTRPGMYVGGVDDTTQLLTELIGNIQDEISACKTCNDAIVDQNWNGYQVCADTGRGMPIVMSKDIPGKTSMEVAVTNMHAGSKFSSTDNLRVGFNGCGLKAVNALSERFIIMSRVTPDNYNKSIPVVEEAWNSCGPRQRNELYYILVFEKGYKVYEGVDLLRNLEAKIFNDISEYRSFPKGLSTIVMFKGDPEIYESVSSKLPIKFLQYFLLIQEKIYKRKLNIIVNGESLSGTFKPFKYEILKTITPADTSKNRYVTVYVTFEVDEELGQKQLTGSALGLSCDQGVHINYIESCFEQALIGEYKIKHRFTTNGLKMCVIVIAEDLIFNSQTKERLKSISKVKQTDFNDITKEFVKIFRGNPEYWEAHVGRLNYLAESMKSLSAAEKAQKMIDEAQGRNMFKSKAELIPGFSDATEIKDRWSCEVFLCFTGDTEILTCNNERISFIDLVSRMENGETFYTFSCTKEGIIKPAKIIASKKIKSTDRIVTVTLDNGESFRCTPDHKIMLRTGDYKEAKDLIPGESLMPCYIREVVETKSVDDKIENGKGYYSGKKEFPELFASYGTDYNNNHKVVSIIIEDKEEDVYCLEVDTPEHNFPLAAGVFVSNCEGLSPAGSLKSGRHSTQYHAILPLRGKILNVEGKSMDQALDNKEIFTIFKVIGLGIGENNVTTDCKTPEEAYEKIRKYSRFGKIIIAVDADSDGAAIAKLLLYLFGKFGKFLIDFGMVYKIESPIYEQNGNKFYPGDPIQPGTTFPIGLDPSKPFHRYKGLGAFNKDQIYDIFYNPMTRRLVQVTPEGFDYSMKLSEDINERKKLLFDSGIITNPYGFTDL